MTNADAADLIVDLLQRGHAVRFRARGDSMYPIIRAEEVVHVEPQGTLERGAVVLALSERGLTAHRVVSVDGEVVVMRGDNAASDDSAIPHAAILGYVTHVEREGRMLPIGHLTLAHRLRRIVRRWL